MHSPVQNRKGKPHTRRYWSSPGVRGSTRLRQYENSQQYSVLMTPIFRGSWRSLHWINKSMEDYLSGPGTRDLVLEITLLSKTDIFSRKKHPDHTNQEKEKETKGKVSFQAHSPWILPLLNITRPYWHVASQ